MCPTLLPPGSCAQWCRWQFNAKEASKWRPPETRNRPSAPLPSAHLQRRKRQLKAKEAGKVEAAHVSAGGAVLGLIAGAGQAAAMTKVGIGWWAGVVGWEAVLASEAIQAVRAVWAEGAQGMRGSRCGLLAGGQFWLRDRANVCRAVAGWSVRRAVAVQPISQVVLFWPATRGDQGQP